MLNDMPLYPGRDAIAKNIRTLVKEGKSRDQAIAIALEYAKKRPSKVAA